MSWGVALALLACAAMGVLGALPNLIRAGRRRRDEGDAR